MLLMPEPWIGNIKMRPFTEYGPYNTLRGPFNRSSYFPSGFSLKPLFIFNLKRKSIKKKLECTFSLKLNFYLLNFMESEVTQSTGGILQLYYYWWFNYV